MADNVNHPNHYQSETGLEVIDAIKAFCGNFKAYCAGNVIKYVARYDKKNGLEDLQKAQVYLNWLIEEVEEKENKNENV